MHTASLVNRYVQTGMVVNMCLVDDSLYSHKYVSSGFMNAMFALPLTPQRSLGWQIHIYAYSGIACIWYLG